jgi:hypothetical protein
MERGRQMGCAIDVRRPARVVVFLDLDTLNVISTVCNVYDTNGIQCFRRKQLLDMLSSQNLTCIDMPYSSLRQ